MCSSDLVAPIPDNFRRGGFDHNEEMRKTIVEAGRIAGLLIEPMLSCGECKHCAEGEEPYCRESLPNTFGIGINGGMAERIVVPERFLIPLDTRVPVEDAFLVEPLAVAVRSLGRAGVTKGDRVCVIGAGTIGLCCVAVAKYLGATVELESRHSHQLEAGSRLGAIEPSNQPASIVIEAAGTSSALSWAIEKCQRQEVGMIDYLC